MRVTQKGQVTIPQAIRAAARMEPGTEVAFSIDANGDVRLRPSRGAGRTELRAALSALRGRGSRGMSTEEIMALTRG